MNRPTQISSEPASRRFLLLPEDALEASAGRPQIRRYRLASIGRRAGLNSADLALAREAGECSGLRRSRG